MTALRLAMSEYVDEVTAGVASARTEELRKRLRQIQHRNMRYFNFAVCMLAATFLVAMGVILFALSSRSAAAVAAVLGVSIIGMIRTMLSLWREKVATEMMIELSELDDVILGKVVAKLLRRMRR
jgi:steroid 5-alpha reductase family enzyme